MMLYGLVQNEVAPDSPVRTKAELRRLLNKWDNLTALGSYELNQRRFEIEQDIHALAHIAMQHLPD